MYDLTLNGKQRAELTAIVENKEIPSGDRARAQLLLASNGIGTPKEIINEFIFKVAEGFDANYDENSI